METIKTLYRMFGFLGWFELFAASLVVSGCAGEFWILANKLTRHIEPVGKTTGVFWSTLVWIDSKIRPLLLRLKIKGRKLPLAKEELLERLFAVLVALGVGLELLALPFSMKEIADLNEKASSADERAKNVQSGNLVLQKEVETLKIGKLELEKQVLTLVEKTKTRSISKNGKDALIVELKGVQKGNVEIVMFDKDAEGIAFGNDLKNTLRAAGLSVTFTPRSIFNLDSIPGVVESGFDLVFCVKDRSSPPLFARVLLTRLRLDGIKADGWPTNSSFSDDLLQIWVCPKAPRNE